MNWLIGPESLKLIHISEMFPSFHTMCVDNKKKKKSAMKAKDFYLNAGPLPCLLAHQYIMMHVEWPAVRFFPYRSPLVETLINSHLSCGFTHLRLSSETWKLKASTSRWHHCSITSIRHHHVTSQPSWELTEAPSAPLGASHFFNWTSLY